MKKRHNTWVIIATLSLIASVTGCTPTMDSTMESSEVSSESSVIQEETASSSSVQSKVETSSSDNVSNSRSSTIQTESSLESVSESSLEESVVESVTEESSIVVIEDSSSAADNSATADSEDEESSTESVVRYGICQIDTIVMDENGNQFDLYKGQKVMILVINEETYTICWNGNSTATVDSLDVELFGPEYTPNFAQGQWAGVIY